MPSEEERARLGYAVAAATFTAPALAAIPALLVGISLGGVEALAGAGRFFVIVTAIAGAHVLLLGFPLFLALRLRGPVGWVAAGHGGVLLGALPVQIFADPGFSSRVGLGLFGGLFGLFSALTFWRVLYRQ